MEAMFVSLDTLAKFFSYLYGFKFSSGWQARVLLKLHFILVKSIYSNISKQNHVLEFGKKDTTAVVLFPTGEKEERNWENYIFTFSWKCRKQKASHQAP